MRVAVGCSYTQGIGIEFSQTYPVLLGYENWARAGSDIEFSLWQAHRAVEAGATDILFQITSWDRITLAAEDRHNFSANRPYTGEPKYEHYTIADYATGDDPYVKWLYEFQVMTNWRTENLAYRMLELNSWAQSRGCSIRWFDWLQRHGIAHHPSLKPLLPPQSVLDWLGTDYFVDEYYHVNSEGHERIAREYLER